MSDGAVTAVHPEIWALTRLAAAAGGDVSDAFALGVCGGAGLIGVAFRDTRAGFSHLHLSGWNPFQSNLLAGLERLGLSAEVRETTGRRRAARNLNRALADGGLAALWVDGATVGLAPQPLTGMSPTVVVARETAGGEVELAQGPGNVVVVGRDQLSEGRLANRTHRTRAVTVTAGAVGELAQLYRRGLAAVAVGPIGGPPDGSGSRAIRELADALTADGPGSWMDTFPGGWELTRSLVSLHAAVRREDGLLRRHQAGFTAEAARATGMTELTAIAAQYGELASEWNELAEAALPADVPELGALRTLSSAWDLPRARSDEPFPLSADATTELLHGLAARLSALADREQATLEDLRRVLSS